LENCVFTNDGSPVPAPRLPVLGPEGVTTTLVKLTKEQLTDGPWCPDANSPNHFDADLFRIRKIGVRIRLQTGNDSLRGPAGTLFTYGGTSRGGNKYIPDQEVGFQVTPRNLNLPMTTRLRREDGMAVIVALMAMMLDDRPRPVPGVDDIFGNDDLRPSGLVARRSTPPTRSSTLDG
jgi:hypothetical protein